MCNCIKAVNERLVFSNAKIAQGFTYNIELMTMDLSGPMIVLSRIDKSKRNKLPVLLATYCPFCGTKLDDKS
jgi:hypothetical protein